MNPVEFSFLSWLADRMKEASSWGGMAAVLLGTMHIAQNPDVLNAAFGVVVAIGGLLSVVLKEGVAK